MRRRQRGTERGALVDEPIVNLTPLIDVVFVVLILFILVAPLLEVDQVQLAHSSSTETQQLSSLQEAHPVQVTVNSDNTIRLNKRLVNGEVLQALLREEKKRYPDAVPLIVHDGRAQFGTYQVVKGAVESAGYRQMDVVLKPG